jgi:hypothetical protein
MNPPLEWFFDTAGKFEPDKLALVVGLALIFGTFFGVAGGRKWPSKYVASSVGCGLLLTGISLWLIQNDKQQERIYDQQRQERIDRQQQQEREHADSDLSKTLRGPVADNLGQAYGEIQSALSSGSNKDCTYYAREASASTDEVRKALGRVGIEIPKK